MSHKIKNRWTNDLEQKQVICSCGDRSPWSVTLGEAEDWFHGSHMIRVRQIQAQLRTSNPSLASQRDYYEEMADDPKNSDYDRGLWRQLANEVTRRLNDRGDTSAGQEQLSFE